MSQRHLPMKSRQTKLETTRRPILPEIELVNLPLVEFHSSISAGASQPKTLMVGICGFHLTVFDELRVKILSVGEKKFYKLKEI